jgi:hypothetical protein
MLFPSSAHAPGTPTLAMHAAATEAPRKSQVVTSPAVRHPAGLAHAAPTYLPAWQTSAVASSWQVAWPGLHASPSFALHPTLVSAIAMSAARMVLQSIMTPPPARW